MNTLKITAVTAGVWASTLAAIAQTNVFPSSGGAGIGTTSPVGALHIAKPDAMIYLQDTGGRAYSVASRWGGYFTIFDETDTSQARISIRPDGAVGINKTLPDSRLHVYDGTGSGPGVLIQAGYPFGAGLYPSVLSLKDKDGTYELLNVKSDGSFFFNRGPMRVLTGAANGNLGIGTATPEAVAHISSGSGGVVDLLKLQSAYGAVGDGGNVVWRDYTRDYVRARSVVEGAAQVGLAIDTFSGGVMSEKIRISTGGNVGIGTSSPGSKLTVVGNIRGSAGDLQVDAGHGLIDVSSAASVMFDGAGKITATTQNNQPFIFTGGNVGIGTSNPGTNKLAVNGTIRAKEVVVETTGWSDYVFADNYDLKPLSEVEQHIKAHKHLPGIPSAAEVSEKGVGVGEMQAKLLAKVEELTLHMINLQKENEALKARVQSLESK